MTTANEKWTDPSLTAEFLRRFDTGGIGVFSPGDQVSLDRSINDSLRENPDLAERFSAGQRAVAAARARWAAAPAVETPAPVYHPPPGPPAPPLTPQQRDQIYRRRKEQLWDARHQGTNLEGHYTAETYK